MKITRIETFILHVPVTNQSIQDSTHRLSHWGHPGVIVHTDEGINGIGFSGTHAHLATDRLITQCIQESYAPLLIGKDPLEVRHLWQSLHDCPPIMWVGRCGLTHLALAAVDIALWDIKAKAADMPLWKLLGGSSKDRIEAYNTDAGWLDRPIAQLVDGCRRSVEEEGFRGVKLKVGSPQPNDDFERVEAARAAIGPKTKLMTDANGRFDIATAKLYGRKLSDFDVHWLEEPMWCDDVRNHAALAAFSPTPIALGEQLYTSLQFRDFVNAGAVQIVQPDVVRLAGVTEWWQVADLAWANRLPVVSHVGDMMQVHLHLAIAHPACHSLEYIPWTRECFVEPATTRDGYFVPPEMPGAGTELRTEAVKQYRVQ